MYIHMLCGGGGSKEGRKGAGEDDFSTMRIVASIDHGGRRHPTAATGPHSRRRDILQSAIMLRDNSMSLKIENILDITIYYLFKGTVHCRHAVQCGPKWTHSLLESQGLANQNGEPLCQGVHYGYSLLAGTIPLLI